MSNKHYTSIEETLSLPNLDSICISEDGKFTAYVKRTTDWKNNSYKYHTWVYSQDSGKSYPITVGSIESTSPNWSPINNYLAYTTKVLEKDKAKNQIFLKTDDEFNGLQLTNAPEGIIQFEWAPDGKGIYYVSMEPESEELKTRKKVYGDFEYVDKENRNSILYYIDLEQIMSNFSNIDLPNDKVENTDDSDKVKYPALELTDPKSFNVVSFNISPNCEKVAILSTPNSRLKMASVTTMHLLDISTKELKTLDFNERFAYGISFSPDSKKLAFCKTPLIRDAYKNCIYDQEIFQIYDLEKNETILTLSDFDKSYNIVKWTSKGILLHWQHRANFHAGILSEDGTLSTVCEEDMSFIIDISITNNGENMAYIKGNDSSFFEAYLNGSKITNISDLYKDKLLSVKELITWTTRDGLEIEGVLSKPHDFDPNKKYPLLVTIHGGPTSASYPIHNMNRLYPIEEFVEHGYVVIEPNYRGSSGYGNTFRKANYKNLGLGDYEDVISGVDMLISKGLVDTNRIGVMGWSQGGYISAFCSTYSNRFKAISVGAGISNWVTYYCNTDITQFTLQYLGDNPWNCAEVYNKTSPMTYINSACTPTLIQHGDSDVRVPVPNAFELYRGLQDRGIESELVLFKGMSHAPTTPGIYRAIMEQNLDWFIKRV